MEFGRQSARMVPFKVEVVKDEFLEMLITKKAAGLSAAFFVIQYEPLTVHHYFLDVHNTTCGRSGSCDICTGGEFTH